MDRYIYAIGTGGRLRLITFQFRDRRVVCNDKGFMEALQRYDKTEGIRSIKWLNGEQWVRASKKEIRDWLSPTPQSISICNSIIISEQNI